MKTKNDILNIYPFSNYKYLAENLKQNYLIYGFSSAMNYVTSCTHMSFGDCYQFTKICKPTKAEKAGFELGNL